MLEAVRKSGKLDIRSLQALLHHSLTHMRINQLEKELKELQKVVKEKGEDWEIVPDKTKFPVFLPKIQRTAPSEFVQTEHSVLLPVSQQAAIEVSVAQGLFGTQNVLESGEQDSYAPAAQKMPEGILIRSHSLLSYLDEVLDADLMSAAGETTVNVTRDRVFYAVIFLRPFKLFALSEEKIRKSVAQLEERMTQSATKQPGSAAATTSRGKREMSKGKRYNYVDLQKELNLLIEVLDSDLKATFDLRKKVDDGIDVDVEYEDLWHVFRRGDILVSRYQPDHVFRLLNIAGGRDPLSHGPFHYDERLEGAKSVDGFALDCYSLSSNGVSYVPRLEHFSIRRFFGTQRVTELPYFPVRFHPDAAKLTTEMTERGRVYYDLTRQPFQHMLAKGRTLDEPRQDIEAQVIVDMVLALNAEPDWRPPGNMNQEDLTEQDARETVTKPYCGHHTSNQNCCGSHSLHNDYTLEDKETSRFITSMGGSLFRSLHVEEVAEEHFMLMRPYVHAFVLRSRDWVTLNVSDLGPVIFESSFRDLRIPDEHKKVVQALVKTHEAGKKGGAGLQAQSIGAAMDIVKGKGRGLIILLHGAPGVGKTSTAECVADDTRRPLYPITCGDIGETALEVEKNLHNSFQLAQKWGCVLLLDEADVFLTKRTRSDLRHNAVTSVFLRSLEYYSGILFLTTNRVGVMDLAFKSRIQMTLFYQKLDLQVTLKLYEMFIERAKKEQVQRESYRFRIKEKEIMKFAKKHFVQLERDGLDTWNGRQIRNAFQTAIALVEYESTVADPEDPKPILGKKQFDSVAKGARKFDEYLTSTTGKSESDAARADSWRDDRFYLTSGGPTGLTVRSMPAQYMAPKGLQKREAAHDDDTYSDSDSNGSGSEDDSEAEEAERRARAKKAGKAKAASKSPGRAKEEASASADMSEQFKQFLEWQKMQQG
ncbi:hypothetical protein F5X68DRAFT_245697 [Plectosphaerella plurivora]|uniref:AAA+ ATPase domain-containing protein n=1 Tax=Plectosphaerella plurivora TaxID=936078 RepID=A0A9P8V5X0_9PEZI|nr:hypothetical protein F5X68DRAFT_245697 [Plectosphaerella plurivora]